MVYRYFSKYKNGIIWQNSLVNIKMVVFDKNIEIYMIVSEVFLQRIIWNVNNSQYLIPTFLTKKYFDKFENWKI